MRRRHLRERPSQSKSQVRPWRGWGVGLGPHPVGNQGGWGHIEPSGFLIPGVLALNGSFPRRVTGNPVTAGTYLALPITRMAHVEFSVPLLI